MSKKMKSLIDFILYGPPINVYFYHLRRKYCYRWKRRIKRTYVHNSTRTLQSFSRFKDDMGWYKQHFTAKLRELSDSLLFRVFVIFCVTIIAVPSILATFIIEIGGSIGSATDWLGFWGSYLGAIIAIFGVYWQVTRQTSSENNRLYLQKRPQLRLVITSINNDRINPQNSVMTIQKYPNEPGHKQINRFNQFSRLLDLNKHKGAVPVISLLNISDNRFNSLVIIIKYVKGASTTVDRFLYNGLPAISDDFSKEMPLLYSTPYLLKMGYENKQISNLIDSITVYGLTSVNEILMYTFTNISMNNYVPSDVKSSYQDLTVKDDYVRLAGNKSKTILSLTKIVEK